VNHLLVATQDHSVVVDEVGEALEDSAVGSEATSSKSTTNRGLLAFKVNEIP
jgi:hypothetical protein